MDCDCDLTDESKLKERIDEYGVYRRIRYLVTGVQLVDQLLDHFEMTMQYLIWQIPFVCLMWRRRPKERQNVKTAKKAREEATSSSTSGQSVARGLYNNSNSVWSGNSPHTSKNNEEKSEVTVTSDESRLK